MSILLDGKKLSEKILDELKETVTQMNMPITLGIVLVGEDPASKAYVEQKKRAGERIGVKVKVFPYPETISARELRAEIARICHLPSMRGVIVQLPLPARPKPLGGEGGPHALKQDRILNAILPKLDVDVLGRTMFGAFALGNSPIMPPTLAGIIRLLDEYKISLDGGKHVVLYGAGRLIGFPTAIEMMKREATISVINKTTKNPERITKEADILITGTPIPAHIGGDMLKDGVVIIDGGYGRTPEGKLTGNVIFDEAEKKASYITPVPGGIGIMTVAMLFYNLIELTKYNTKG
ncbi:MAG: bifunctional 5,10-methylenetetrahydrofolate dehydrogenase/5,10-methenyltetrahydrofolate cyclohydrolase [Candidatus Spechtbacteria bacterium]|nr:bifunctional 5,10-methylenetetrahydrofolate dehydrogenase/5,10-methenyltetrahydrofolate cyclohydrolase [Candidatus Spechtbacteria bacterium]